MKSSDIATKITGVISNLNEKYPEYIFKGKDKSLKISFKRRKKSFLVACIEIKDHSSKASLDVFVSSFGIVSYDEQIAAIQNVILSLRDLGYNVTNFSMERLQEYNYNYNIIANACTI